MRNISLVLVLLSWLQAADALTIYRIGGAGQPAPELDVAYEFEIGRAS